MKMKHHTRKYVSSKYLSHKEMLGNMWKQKWGYRIAKRIVSCTNLSIVSCEIIEYTICRVLSFWKPSICNSIGSIRVETNFYMWSSFSIHIRHQEFIVVWTEEHDFEIVPKVSRPTTTINNFLPPISARRPVGIRSPAL